MGFLNYDSPFMTGLRKLVNYVFLGILWVIASVPIITFGAATTAMFYTAENIVRKDREKLFSAFWTSFRVEFKQATVLWAIALLLIVPLVLNAYLLWSIELPSYLYAVLFISVLFGFCWMQLWFPYLSTFEDKVVTLLGNTFRVTLTRLLWACLMLLAAAAAAILAVVAFFFVPPVLFIIPGIYSILASRIFRIIFKDFLPEEEKENTSGKKHVEKAFS